MSFDYRGSRDRVWGIVRRPDGGFRGVVRRPGLSRSERALLLALIEFAPNIEPSVATLADMLESDDRTVKRLLRELQTKGCLRVTLRTGERSFYELALPQIPVDDPPANDGGDGVAGGDVVVGGTPLIGVTPPPSLASPEADKEADKEAGNGRARRRATPKSTKSKLRQTRNRALPEDWQPNAQHEADAKQGRLELAHETELFRDYHKAKGSLFVDWDAAFRNWLRKALSFRSGGRQKSQPQPSGPYFDVTNVESPDWVSGGAS